MDKAYSRIIWQNQPSTATALGATNLNRIDVALNEVDNRVVAMDTSKAESSVVNNTVQSITFNDATGIMTITKVNGTSTAIDTKLEKLAVNFAYNPDTQQLDITLDDGTVQHVDLSSLITQYEFSNSDTIMWTLVDGVIKADIINGSIPGEKLQPNYLADIIVQANIATNQAALSKRYAVGGVEEGDANDNAKYYKEQAEAAATAAEEIAGFNPALYLQKTGDSKDNTVSFAEAVALTNIDTGETHATLFGKIKKFFSFIGTTVLTTVAQTISGAINELKSGKMDISVFDPQGKNQDVFAYAKGLFDGVTGFAVSVVSALPTTNIDTHTIYFVPKSAGPSDNYDEYMYINGAWEHVGSTTVDLSNYIPKTDIVDNLTTNDATKPLSAKQGKAINDNLAGKIVSVYVDLSTATVNTVKEAPFPTGVTRDKLTVIGWRASRTYGAPISNISSMLTVESSNVIGVTPKVADLAGSGASCTVYLYVVP